MSLVGAGTARRFWDQSYGKSVGSVSTLFGQDAAHVRRARSSRSADERVAEALRATTTTQLLGQEHDGWDAVMVAAFEAVRVRRVTPLDPYAAHRAYPSPRSMFAADLFLETAAGEATGRVCPLTATCTSGKPTDVRAGLRVEGGGLLAIGIVPERFPRPYGTLRETLADLEAGHLAATVALTLHRARQSFRVHLGGVGPIGSETVGVLDAATAPPGVRLAAWLDHRSSGWTGVTLANSPSVSAQGIAAVDRALLLALETLAPMLPDADAVHIHRHELDAATPGTRTTVRLGAAETTKSTDGLVPPFMSSIGYSMTVDVAAWLDTHGDRAPATVHTVLGWIAQWACLAAAAAGLTARPMRNFDEAEWAAALDAPLAHTVAYQLWLRPWPDGDAKESAWSLRGVTA